MAKKAKIASKNNPAGRTSAKKYMLNGKEIRPVKVVLQNTFMGAEYAADGALIMDNSGNPINWKSAASMCAMV